MKQEPGRLAVRKIGEALGRENAHHASFAGARE